jgi:hypothetical protein
MTTLGPGEIIPMTPEQIANMERTLVQPTMALRFIERDGRRVLQQGFELQTWKGSRQIAMSQEWRDVPFVGKP